jgi:hypothetical protein
VSQLQVSRRRLVTVHMLTSSQIRVATHKTLAALRPTDTSISQVFLIVLVLHELTLSSGYKADGGVSGAYVLPVAIADIPFSQYISWITNDVVAWTLDASGVVADPLTEIADRPIPQEPMVTASVFNCPFAHDTCSTSSLTWASLQTSQ